MAKTNTIECPAVVVVRIPKNGKAERYGIATLDANGFYSVNNTTTWDTLAEARAVASWCSQGWAGGVGVQPPAKKRPPNACPECGGASDPTIPVPVGETNPWPYPGWQCRNCDHNFPAT